MEDYSTYSDEELGGLFKIHRDRLYILRSQAARFGELHTPPHVFIEIRELEQKCQTIEQELRHRKPPPTPRDIFVNYVQVTLHIEGQIEEFDDEKKEAIITNLIRLTKADRKNIRIVRIIAGSVKVIIELPKAAADLLLSLSPSTNEILKELHVKTITTSPEKSSLSQRIGRIMNNRQTSWRQWGDHPVVVSVVVITAIISTFFLFFDNNSSSQYTYRGRVRNATTNQVVAGAKITLDLQGKSFIVFTESEGVYRFTLQQNESSVTGRIRVDATDYKPYEREITITSNQSELEDIRLEPDLTRTPVPTEESTLVTPSISESPTSSQPSPPLPVVITPSPILPDSRVIAYDDDTNCVNQILAMTIGKQSKELDILLTPIEVSLQTKDIESLLLIQRSCVGDTNFLTFTIQYTAHPLFFLEEPTSWSYDGTSDEVGLLIRANILSIVGQYADAYSQIETRDGRIISEIRSTYFGGWWLGNLCLRLDVWDCANTSYDQALADPEKPNDVSRLQSNLAMNKAFYKWMKQDQITTIDCVQNGRALITQAIEAQPDKSLYHINFALFLLLCPQADASGFTDTDININTIKALDKVSDQDKDTWFYAIQGWVYYHQLEKSSIVQSALCKSIQLDPSNTFAYRILSKLYGANNTTDLGLEMFEEYRQTASLRWQHQEIERGFDSFIDMIVEQPEILERCE